MKFRWIIIGLAILILLSYYIFPLLWLLVALIIFALLYPLIRKYSTPKGKRIRHKILKSYLREQYGKGGDEIYKGIIYHLKKKGYR